MAARKVIESVEVAPPFANAVRLVAGTGYPSGLFIGRRNAPIPWELVQGEYSQWSGTGEWGFLPRRGFTMIHSEHPYWHVPTSAPSRQYRTLSSGDHLQPGILYVKADKDVRCGVALTDESNFATFLLIRWGDEHVIENECVVKWLSHNSCYSSRICWKPFR